jgi:O-methyltransferase
MVSLLLLAAFFCAAGALPMSVPAQHLRHKKHNDVVIKVPMIEEAILKVSNYTMVSHNKMRIGWTMITDALVGVKGDFIECGVWRGGNVAFLALAEMQVSGPKPTRDIWLFDTFEGLPAPDPVKNPDAHKVWEKIEKTNSSRMAPLYGGGYIDENKQIRWNYSPIQAVEEVVFSTGYPRDKFHFVKGKVEDSLISGVSLPDKIAFLRLDTDWYESTKAEFDVLASRLVPGGVLMVDDYYEWKGSKKATDEFMAQHADEYDVDATKNMYWAIRKPDKI